MLTGGTNVYCVKFRNFGFQRNKYESVSAYWYGWCTSYYSPSKIDNKININRKQKIAFNILMGLLCYYL